MQCRTAKSKTLTYRNNSVTQCHSFRSHPVLLSDRVSYWKFFSYVSGSHVCVSAVIGLEAEQKLQVGFDFRKLEILIYLKVKFGSGSR